MGNCLVMEKKVIKIVRNDGKVLEYREPISVHNILSQFSNHSLSHNNNNNTCHHNLLPHDAKLLSGNLYYLLPTTTITKKTKKVTFATPEVEEDDGDDTCKSNININDDDDDDDAKKSVSHVVRMKIVVHKQELEKLLQGGSLHEMVYQSLEKQCSLSDYHDHHDVDDNNDLECNKSWRPILDCIPESN